MNEACVLPVKLQFNLGRSLRFVLICASFFMGSIIHSSAWASGGLSLTDVLDPLPELDRAISTPAAAMGLPLGQRHWYHHEIVAYLDTLADQSPRMKALGEHASSHGGRSLVAYAISSPANLARLDDIRATRKRLTDPAAELDVAKLPAVLHMGYSVHGNESSAANATPLVAYYLNAAQDPALATQLEKLVILLNPVFNPDGLDRFAHWSNNRRGRVPSPDPHDREHREPFNSGRTNYYWFDLNRDWMPHQHPESQGRVRFFHTWKPNVQLDFHEMGSNSTYFFMPGVPERTNPLTPALNQKLTNAIADYHRQAFDEQGTLYWSGERFDDFFVGKGSTYPDLFGCVGILFEQASSRGVHQDTKNGRLTFAQTITNQFRMSLSSISATAALKDDLYDYQRGFYADSLKAGKAKGGYYLATTSEDPTRLREFVRILQGHDIKVLLLTKSVDIDGHTYPAHGSIAIPLAQAHYSFLQSLWERRTEFAENIFYDISAWTLPLAFNLKHTLDPVKDVVTQVLPASFPAREVPHEFAESPVGYLIDWWDSATPALLYALLEAEANVRVATRPFTATLAGGKQRSFGYGTLFVSRALSPKICPKAQRLLQAAAARGEPVYPVKSSATVAGIDLGSPDFQVLKKPKVILVTGPGMSQFRLGEMWHLFDQRVRLPITMVDWTRLGGVDLHEYTHVLLVRGLAKLSEETVKKLRSFVQGGGVLWAQGSHAVKWVIEKELAEGRWRKSQEEKAKAAREAAKQGQDKEKSERQTDNTESEFAPVERSAFAEARKRLELKRVKGAIFATSLDTSHPLGYGYDSEFLPVFCDHSQFLEPAVNAYSTPVLYTDSPLLSGYISEENLELLSGSASLIVDQQKAGAVVLALDNPCFRAFWWGTQRLLINAVFFGQLLEEPD